jgi:hypothetical protein
MFDLCGRFAGLLMLCLWGIFGSILGIGLVGLLSILGRILAYLVMGVGDDWIILLLIIRNTLF